LVQHGGECVRTDPVCGTELGVLGRQREPDDIAYGALYLASDESGFVTGSELVIDGGCTAH
jgi:NAD(P)-dependent dehydrogenase (short-subunit alcohol dehydrogenase family)